jgi:hypothetical protein
LGRVDRKSPHEYARRHILSPQPTRVNARRNGRSGSRFALLRPQT